MNKVETAIALALKAHTGQTDRDDESYILHPLTVGLMGRTDEERMAGFLHDVIEDSDMTAEDLLEAGIPESVVNALKLLTHDEQTSYEDYLQRIIDSGNPIALRTKFNDLTHNYARGKAYPDLQKKHGAALEKLRPVIEQQEKVERYELKAEADRPLEVAVFAAGCFWGVQHYMDKQKGVVRSLVGYTGGTQQNPNYELVRKHQTDHLEAVLVEFDPTIVSYEDLCKLFFEIHDPAQTDGQGPDKGAQYLSAVFFRDEAQLTTTNKLVSYLRNKGDEVNTRIKQLGTFWIAEQYHQHYYDNTNGSPYCHIRMRKFPR